MTKRLSTFLNTTTRLKPTPVRPVTAIKPVAPFVWKATQKLPKADPTALTRGGPAGSRARSTGKC